MENISGLVVAGSHPDPFESKLLAVAMWREDTAEGIQLTAHADDIEERTLDKYPALAGMDLAGETHTSAETAREIGHDIRDVWHRAGTIAVWDAPAVFTTLANNDSTFNVDGPVVDLRVLDRALFPDRRGKRTPVSLAEYVGVSYRDFPADMPGEAELLAVLASRLVRGHPALAQSPEDLMDRQREWHLDQTEGLRDWLNKQNRPTNHVDPSWPMRQAALGDEDQLSLIRMWLDGTGDVRGSQARDALNTLRRGGYHITR